MTIEKSRLENLKKQVPEAIKAGQIVIDGDIIHFIGHKYTYKNNNGEITIECLSDPFIAKVKDSENSIEIIEGIYNGRRSKADRALKKYGDIVSILYVAMEN